MASLEKRVEGIYSLRQVNNGAAYILVSPTTRDSTGGALGGDLLQLAWWPDFILALRRDSDTTSSFMLLDAVEGEVVAGPAPELNLELPPDFAMRTASEAWAELK